MTKAAAAEPAFVPPSPKSDDASFDDLDFDAELEFLSSVEHFCVDMKTEALFEFTMDDKESSSILLPSIIDPIKVESGHSLERPVFEQACVTVFSQSIEAAAVSDLEELSCSSTSSLSEESCESLQGGDMFPDKGIKRCKEDASTSCSSPATDEGFRDQRLRDTMLNLLECMKRTDMSRRQLFQMTNSFIPSASMSTSNDTSKNKPKGKEALHETNNGKKQNRAPTKAIPYPIPSTKAKWKKPQEKKGRHVTASKRKTEGRKSGTISHAQHFSGVGQHKEQQTMER